MTTTAADDRVIRHGAILELNAWSDRTESAQGNRR